MNFQPAFLTYNSQGHAENCVAIGNPDALRKILIIPPLFDEMNRIRRVIVSAMQILSDRNILSFLPDLPGTNESLTPLKTQDLASWRAAISDITAQFGITHIASIRGGALIDDGPSTLPHWRLAPAKGASLLKIMLRTRIAGDKEAGKTTTIENLMAIGRHDPTELSGHIIGPAMLASLESAEPAALDALCGVAIGHDSDNVEGSALWLRAEPQDDPVMSRSIADNLDRWSTSCGG